MKQGEIYLVDLDPVVGLEAGGQQLVVVVSNDSINASFLPALIAPVRDATGIPIPRLTGVFIPANESSLMTDVIVDCLQVRALDRNRFPAAPVGTLPVARLKDIERSLHYVFRV